MQLNNGKDQNGNIVIGESDLSNIHSAQTPIQASTVEKYFHRPLAPFTVTEVTYAMGWKNGFYKGRQNLETSARVRHMILAHRIRNSEILPWDRKSYPCYLTQDVK